ncbi:MAG: glycosyltransferase family 4 protein [Bacteroidota bacterium]|nr:glycosyltransferase family 4 protein [Bacteroidota bacterium]
MIKVLFLTRFSINSVFGGDTVQLNMTAKYLRKIGVKADIISNNEEIEYENYDLIHFFNIIRPAEMLYHIGKTNKPFVISTIYVNYWDYENYQAKSFKKFLLKLINVNTLEYLKVWARFMVNGERIKSTKYIFKGQESSIKHLLEKAVMILPNSNSECLRIKNDYGTNTPSSITCNGIDADVFGFNKNNILNREGALCIGRIEGRKNQLNLIRAINQTNIPLTIIGKPAPNHMKYFEQCKKEAGKNVLFIDFMDQQELVNYYAKSKVHILPSWFETTGLVSLEAAAMGCNIVITDKGDTREYFGEDAFYCEPDDIDSIKNAIIRAYESPVNEKLQKMVIENYTWQKAAEQTLAAYNEVLSKKE